MRKSAAPQSRAEGNRTPILRLDLAAPELTAGPRKAVTEGQNPAQVSLPGTADSHVLESREVPRAATLREDAGQRLSPHGLEQPSYSRESAAFRQGSAPPPTAAPPSARSCDLAGGTLSRRGTSPPGGASASRNAGTRSPQERTDSGGRPHATFRRLEVCGARRPDGTAPLLQVCNARRIIRSDVESRSPPRSARQFDPALSRKIGTIQRRWAKASFCTQRRFGRSSTCYLPKVGSMWRSTTGRHRAAVAGLQRASNYSLRRRIAIAAALSPSIRSGPLSQDRDHSTSVGQGQLLYPETTVHDSFMLALAWAPGLVVFRGRGNESAQWLDACR